MNNQEVIATLACKAKRKTEFCNCAPCQARREIYGKNIPCQIQEMRRIAFATGQIKDLKDASKD